MINLRKAALPPKPLAPTYVEVFNDGPVNSLSPIQKRMMDFYTDNPRCAIEAPRQIGKSTFLIMQSIMSSHLNTIIIVYNQSIKTLMIERFGEFCNTNNIEYTLNNRDTFTIGGFHTTIAVMNSVDVYNSDYSLNNYDEVFIDEYQYMDIAINLIRKDRVILIGTPGGNGSMAIDNTGMFAGLIINDGD